MRDPFRGRGLCRNAGLGATKLPFLRGILPFKHGIPAHDRLNDVMNGLDGALFAAAFTAWVDGLREAEPDIVATCGKTSRRAHARACGLASVAYGLDLGHAPAPGAGSGGDIG